MNLTTPLYEIGTIVYWIDEHSFTETLRSATVTETKFSERWQEQFVRTAPPRRAHQPETFLPAKSFYLSAAEAWRALAAEHRRSAQLSAELADIYEKKAQASEESREKTTAPIEDDTPW